MRSSSLWRDQRYYRRVHDVVTEETKCPRWRSRSARRRARSIRASEIRTVRALPVSAARSSAGPSGASATPTGRNGSLHGRHPLASATRIGRSLPAGPFRQTLEQKKKEYGSVDLLAQLSGIPAGRINDIIGQRADIVYDGEVDAFCIGEGTMLEWEIYPELAEAA